MELKEINNIIGLTSYEDFLFIFEGITDKEIVVHIYNIKNEIIIKSLKFENFDFKFENIRSFFTNGNTLFFYILGYKFIFGISLNSGQYFRHPLRFSETNCKFFI